MVETGHVPDGLRQLTYQPGPAAPGPIELLTFAGFRRVDRALRTRPQRPDFDVLALVREGTGRLRVDFDDTALVPRTIAWIRPGQVNQWIDIEDLDGDLVLFSTAAVAFTADPPACWTVPDPAWRLVTLAADHLRAEYDAAPTGPILADLLTVLLRRATADQPQAPEHRDDLARRFRAAVETDLGSGRRRSVAEHAAALGYSARTLDRAVTRATGVSAKSYLDQRVHLEARRMLAHSALSVAVCARHLGFPDAANFSAFFTRLSGTTPGRWRHQATADVPRPATTAPERSDT
ncbi:AraC family transcriptional regulator [Actinomycetospora sp. TBRC 11914]|uniref:helix-turn-helix domain-containing protein n=1 Tax=Actinomycetospora sp. TBRC 11914 TaxID=2729387 RepID=UPI00145D8487|nr:AraC family transcriptional regulator [Actinomycetospora sp. TBRC 11914]NMO88302.1 helix-turn-helix transcriptional regulator [Actinomycetospora sp. TBRC 11914]